MSFYETNVFSSFVIYICLAESIYSIIFFLLALLTLDMIPRILFESVKIWTSTGRFEVKFSCLRVASAPSVRSANAMTSADYTESASPGDFYDLY